MYRITFDFEKNELLIPFEVFEALGNPLDFTFLIHTEKHAFAIAGEIERKYPPGVRKPRPMRASRILRYWDTDANTFRIDAADCAMRMLGGFFLDFNGNGVYIVEGELKSDGNITAMVYDPATASLRTARKRAAGRKAACCG